MALALVFTALPWTFAWAEPSWPWFSAASGIAVLGFITHRAWLRDRQWSDTALRRAAEERAALQAHLDEIPVALYRCRGRYRTGIEWLNRGHALLGRTSDRLGRNRNAFDLLVDDNDLGRVRRDIAASIDAGSTFRLRYDIKRHDGSTGHIEDWGFVVEGAGDDAVVLGCLVDATETRRLEQRVAHSDRLELLGRMAGEVAHDLNNLLSPALMSAQSLSETETGDVAEELTIVANALLASRNLLHQLLDLSRPATGEPKLVRLEELVTSNRLLLSRLAGRRTPMNFELDAAEGLVRAVPGEVQQLLLNLVVNAGEAVCDGGDILVQTRMVTLRDDDNEAGLPPGDYVRLIVHDTGRGMDERTRQRLFEPFFTTKGDKGSGLGMAIVYAVVRRHDGTILVDSEPGRGTRVAVYFPSAAADESSGVVA